MYLGKSKDKIEITVSQYYDLEKKKKHSKTDKKSAKTASMHADEIGIRVKL